MSGLKWAQNSFVEKEKLSCCSWFNSHINENISEQTADTYKMNKYDSKFKWTNDKK